MNQSEFLPTIPGYRVTRVIAVGGMATVYEGASDSTGESVAIKVMASSLGADPSFRRRFLDECQITKELKHENIIHIHAFGCVDSIYYMVMALLQGDTLADRLTKALPENHVVSILAQVAQALGHAHEQGIIHRDVKPSNVLFNSAGVAILSDFGIARAVLSVNNTRAGMVIGTPTYMSPEQSMSEALDNRSDLYSLGVMFYQMLTGELPYQAKEPLALAIQHRNDPIPRLPAHLSRFQTTIDRLLAKKPEERFQSVGALIAALETNASTRLDRTLLRSDAESDANPRTRPPSPLLRRQIEREVQSDLGRKLGAVASSWRVILAGFVAIASIGLIVWRQIPEPPRSAKIGSTSKEIDAAIALCGQFREDCQRSWYEDEKLQTVSLAPHVLDKTEVTNEDFVDFVSETGFTTAAEKLGYSTRFEPQLFVAIEARGYSWKSPEGLNSSYKDRLNHPVTNISYNDAMAYCQWKGARLPTAAEWEYAARGDSGRIFPWGAEWKPDLAHWQNGQAKGPIAVGSITDGKTPEGIADLAGNVWEWTGTTVGGKAVLKGGSWMEANPANLRAAAVRLEDPNIPAVDNGFRCARDVKKWPN